MANVKATLLAIIIFGFLIDNVSAQEVLLAGVAKVDINRAGTDAGDNPPFVKALVITDKKAGTTAVIISLDAVAVAEIGSILDPYMANVRAQLKKELGIDPKTILFNASHCHSAVCKDIDQRTIQAVKKAWENQVPVQVAAGTGQESRIMENRRLKLKSGKTADVRHAYSIPADEKIAAVGPTDPEIGILRFDRVSDGKPLALVFHFSMHPIQGVPGGKTTADISGFAAKVIEEQLGNDAVALFLQGCGGDINPRNYKTPDQPRDARPLGNLLGLSTLKAARDLKSKKNVGVHIVNETLAVPLADLSKRIAEMEKEIDALLVSLKGTTLNLKTFLPLFVKYHLGGENPSAYAMRYLQDEALGIDEWKHLDTVNRNDLDAYIRNIHTMEELTRKQINLALLEKHNARNSKSKSKTLDVEVVGLRVGDFRLITFPGEVTIPIGLGLKKKSSHDLTFISGYTNGYLYYSPTAEQLLNRGGAQEDSDCMLAPEWQKMFETKAMEILKGL